MSFFISGGTAGAFSRITGSLGQAVATLTFDSNFQMVSTAFNICCHELESRTEKAMRSTPG